MTLQATRLLALLPAALLPGCAWRIVPPPAPADPAEVYLTAYAIHTRVALPHGERPDRVIEYGVGDWDYYARGRTGILDGLRALFFSRASALSRRELPRLEDASAFRRAAGGERTVRFLVERARVEFLRDSLESRWASLPEAGSLKNAAEGLEFRKSPEPYHLFRNSNHRSASWLRALGCEVRGPAVLNRFRLEAPRDAPP